MIENTDFVRIFARDPFNDAVHLVGSMELAHADGPREFRLMMDQSCSGRYHMEAECDGNTMVLLN